MRIPRLIALSILTSSLTAAFAQQKPQTPFNFPSTQHPHPRLATENDLDELIDVLISAFKPSAVWQYLLIDPDKYENYTRTCMRKALQEEWENLHSSTTVNVIAMPVEGEEERVVSFAVWNWNEADDLLPTRTTTAPFMTMLQTFHDKCSDNLNTNMTRADDLGDKMSRAMAPYLGNVTTDRHLYLALLATHPDWDGNGFAAAQLDIGLKNATRADVPVTVLSSPAGYPLYDSLGFEAIANITAEMLDGLGVIWHEYMRWDAE